jgi:hypothetical protein
LVIEIWDHVREHVAASKRTEVAVCLLRAFRDFGFEGSDVAEVTEEDIHLMYAYHDVFENIEPDDEDEDEDR